MRKPSRVSAVTDRSPPGTVATRALPGELEARVAAVEASASATDFDAQSWFWMLLLGLGLPIALLVIGWILGTPGP
jgi:hypothetical protein